MDRRDFFRRSLGALASLPFLPKAAGAGHHLLKGTVIGSFTTKLSPMKALPMNPDLGIVGGLPVSVSELQTPYRDRDTGLGVFVVYVTLLGVIRADL